MSWIAIKQKKEERAKNVAKAGAILKRAHAENRDVTPEENREFEDLHKLADELLKGIELLQKQADAEGSMDGDNDEEASRSLARPHLEQRDAKPKRSDEELRSKAFAKYMRGYSLSSAEQRALTVGGSTTGSEMVPAGMWNGYYTRLRDLSSIRRGNPYVELVTDSRATPYPLYNDSSNEGEIITAGDSATGSADPATGKLTLGGHIFSSKRFGLGKDYIRNVNHNAEEAIWKMAAERVSVHLDRKLTVGSGSGEPQGFVTGGGVGKTSTATNAVTYNEILDLIHSLGVAYREGASLFFNDNTLLAVKKLVDADGNSIWFSGAANAAGQGMAPTIAGVPYIVVPYMADLGAGNKPIAMANLSRGYVIREIPQAELFVDPYSNGGKYLIEYIMFSTHDGGVVDSSAIKVLQNAAS